MAFNGGPRIRGMTWTPSAALIGKSCLASSEIVMVDARDR
jgi:hypothetical protein